MAIEYIIDAVAFLKQEYGDISPMALAHSKGILVDAQHYGNVQESFRGFAIQLHGKLHITLNNPLHFFHPFRKRVLHFLCRRVIVSL